MQRRDLNLEQIPQQWLNEIQHVQQYLLAISAKARETENVHLCAVSDIAATALDKVIDIIDPERFFSIDAQEMRNIFDSIIPPYEDK